MTDPLFVPTTPDVPVVRGRRCTRHQWEVRVLTTGGTVIPSASRTMGHVAILPDTRIECARCGKPKDEARARRGRTNRARGNAIEREVGHRLGLRRVGQFGGPDDLRDPLFAAQVKSGGSFSERYWSWLKAVPVDAGQTALLVVTDAPGPGHKRRAIVVLDIEDWRSLHGASK